MPERQGRAGTDEESHASESDEKQRKRRGKKTRGKPPYREEAKEAKPKRRQRRAKLPRQTKQPPSSRDLVARRSEQELEELKLNHGWTVEIEYAMRALRKKCLVYKALYSSGAVKLNRKGVIMGVINVIATVGTGSTLVANVNYESKTLTIVVAIIVYLLSLSIGLNEFLQYRTQAGDWKDAAASFGDVAQMIDRQLIQDPYYRQEAKDFLIWIQREYNQAYDGSPTLSPKALTAFEKKFGAELNPEFLDKKQINEDQLDVAMLMSDDSEQSEGASDAEPDGSDATSEKTSNETIDTDQAERSETLDKQKQRRPDGEARPQDDMDTAPNSPTLARAQRRKTTVGSAHLTSATRQSRSRNAIHPGPSVFTDPGAEFEFSRNHDDLRMMYELARYND